MIVISPIQESILRGLGKYKFLTSHQAWKLIGNKSLQTIYNDLRVLKERGFVDCIVYGGVSRSGTMAKLYYLTTKGANVCADMEGINADQVKFPKSTNTLVKNDFFHRIYTIDLMISLHHWLNQTDKDLMFLDVYFDKTGSQRKQNEGALKGKTRVNIGNDSFIDPDMIFMYRTKQKESLFVLEVANGLDSKRIVQQIKNVVVASYQGHVSEKYGLRTTPKVLVAFEHEGTMKAVMGRVKTDEYLENFDELEEYLFFTLQEKTKGNWLDGWATLSNTSKSIFT